MAALCYEKAAAILARARRADRNHELSGALKHQYRLNPPLDAAVVRLAEETYHFTFPEDYFQFVTRVGDGGAGPGYGIMSFRDSLMSGARGDFREAYRRSLETPFMPRPMTPEEAESSSFAMDAYERAPHKLFIFEKEDGAVCGTDGFFILGTHGCQWDFGLIVSGGRKGQVFSTDNEGGYLFEARSFHEFYQEWLDWLSDTEGLQKELVRRRNPPGNRA